MWTSIMQQAKRIKKGQKTIEEVQKEKDKDWKEYKEKLNKKDINDFF